jgi:predicted DCC family thiol-disulfide oxidoreductase YuxK
MSKEMIDYPSILLFDGVCNLCNGAVQFMIRRDKSGYFHYASLQGQSGSRLLAKHGMPAYTGSIVLIEDGAVYTKSDAALRISKRLGAAWPLLGIFKLVPRKLRDLAYDFIAANRYRWFGKRDACMLPTPEHRSRFLED